MRIGLLTGGGDAPGLNGVIEAAAKVLLKAGCEVVGICDGFEGIFEHKIKAIQWSELEGLHSLAGTFLGTSNRSGTEGREAEFLSQLRRLNLDGLIAAGGDGTFRGLMGVQSEVPLIGVPKTIDNDLAGTDVTFGFDTACTVVAEAVDALRATADAHRRIIVVETMGRTAGWIALGGGLAAYSEVILIPERPFDKQKLLSFLRQKKAVQRGLVMTAAEGARARGEDAHVAFRVSDAPEQERFGGFARELAMWIERELEWESRHVVLGHLQRARHPTATDRFLTMAFGVKAAQLALTGQWGQAAVYRNGQVMSAPIQDLMGAARRVQEDHRWLKMAEHLGVFI